MTLGQALCHPFAHTLQGFALGIIITNTPKLLDHTCSSPCTAVSPVPPSQLAWPHRYPMVALACKTSVQKVSHAVVVQHNAECLSTGMPPAHHATQHDKCNEWRGSFHLGWAGCIACIREHLILGKWVEGGCAFTTSSSVPGSEFCGGQQVGR